MKRIPTEKTALQRILCVFLSCALTISMVPTEAFAELAESGLDAAADAQVSAEAQTDDMAVELDGDGDSGETQSAADAQVSTEAQTDDTAIELDGNSDSDETQLAADVAAADQAQGADSQEEVEPTAESADA